MAEETIEELRKRRKHFRKGFRVALNFLYHHHETMAKTERPPEDKIRFERFLKLHIDEGVVEDAKSIKSIDETGNRTSCDPGYCRVGGTCVLCDFEFAYDAGNFEND